MKYDPLVIEYNRDYQLGMQAGMQAANQQHNQEERRFTAACAAMQGMWADYRVVEAAMPNNIIDEATVKITARLAVMQADALLKELEK